jgi:two-component system, cell cycle response regulator DivK
LGLGFIFYGAMPKTVLIVEDYADTRTLMKYLLEGYGYQIIEAADGQEAVEKVRQQHPDLILMDLSLPVMDGFTATQTIRKFDGGRKIPIIAVTAYGNSFYRKAIEAGCDDLINKPLDFKKLEPILEQYLS